MKSAGVLQTEGVKISGALIVKSTAGYLPTLDGWRAVAITGVLLNHASNAVISPDGSPLLFGFTRIGSEGVDLFFAISGFLITSRLLDEYRKTGQVRLGEFYVRRGCRILPPYLAYLAAVGLGVWAGLWAVSTVDFVTCLTFTRNYMTPFDSGSWFTGHAWSLCVEEHFYLLWPGLLVLLSPRRSLWWAIGLAVGFGVWGVVEFRLQLFPRVLPNVGYYVRTDICLGKLLTGAAMALGVDQYPHIIRAVVRPWAVWPTAAALLMVIVIKPPLTLPSEALLFALLIVSTVLWPDTAVGRTLELPAIRWVGRVSYSLYLWQQIFLVVAEDAHFFVQRFPWNVMAAFVLATASYYLVERPMIRIGRQLAPPISIGRP